MRTFVEVTDNERTNPVTGNKVLTGRIYRTEPENVLDFQTCDLNGKDAAENETITTKFKKDLEKKAANYKTRNDEATKAAAATKK